MNDNMTFKCGKQTSLKHSGALYDDLFHNFFFLLFYPFISLFSILYGNRNTGGYQQYLVLSLGSPNFEQQKNKRKQ